MSRVAVILPTLNADKYLIEAIRSIQNQDMPDWTLHILDGGSTDLTLDICHRLAREDSRLIVHELPGTHPAARTNQLLHQLNETYVAFQHADDVSAPQRLRVQLAHLENHPELALLGSATHVWQHDKENPEKTGYSFTQHYPTGSANIWSRLPFYWCFSLPSLMFHLDKIKSHNLFLDESIQFSADWEWYWRIAQALPVDNLSEPLIAYRHHQASDGPLHRDSLQMEAHHLKQRLLKKTFPFLDADDVTFLSNIQFEPAMSTQLSRQEKDRVETLLGSIIPYYYEPLQPTNSKRLNALCLTLDAYWRKLNRTLPQKPYQQHYVTPVWNRQPYYVVAPRYERTSAGIRALHILAHCLNQKGYPTWLLIQPYAINEVAGPDLITPVLTDAIIERHYQQGLNPIVIYPETIVGNPLNASCVARFILNFPGLLGGDVHYSEEEYCFAYSKALAESCGHPDRVLFIPASDPQVFYPPLEPTERSGTCYYYGKYQEYHGGQTFGVPEDSVEISRIRPDTQGPAEIAELLRHSKLLYVFENTALAIEAVLCGCPVVFMPNPYLTEVIAAKELGWDGMAWGDSPDEINRAKASVVPAAEQYLKQFEQFWIQLQQFVDETQTYVLQAPPARRLLVPELKQELVSLKTYHHLISMKLENYSPVVETIKFIDRPLKTKELVCLLAGRLRRECIRPLRKLIKI